MIEITRARVFGVTLLILGLTATVDARAQNEVPSVTSVIAIHGATVVTAPGQILENGTVVIRDGLIEAVGSDLALPYDARVIRGDSLFVYAGFIDGLGHIGIPAPKERASGNQQERASDPGNPSNERAGIQPDRSASALLDNGDSAIAGYRKVGIAVAHAVPRGRMLPGSGSVVSLTGNMETGVIKDDASMFMQFLGAQGVYPATPMAIMAKFRNLYRQAENENGWQTNFEKNPTGIRRPPNNRVHGSFFGVIDRSQPVVMMTNDALSTYRAMRLQQELGFRLILGGVGQAAEMIEDLTAAGAPILLTMKLPKVEKPSGDKASGKDSTDATGPSPEAQYNPDLRTTSYSDIDNEISNLKARKAAAQAKYRETAAALEKAGVPFGFSTADISAKDFRKHLLKMIEVGLSEEGALAALTTNPASILGIERAAGTIDPGKMGNVVVSSGPYFKEKSFVKYMVVEGELFEYEAPSPKSSKADSDDADQFVGTWRYVTEVEGEDYIGFFSVDNDDGELSGTIQGDQLPETALTNVTIDGSSFAFDFDVPEIGVASFSMMVDGDEGTGDISLPGLGTYPATLKRTSSPD